MKSKAHGKRCPEGTTSGAVLSEPDTEEGGGTEGSFVAPEVTEEHQFSDVEDTDEEEDDNKEADKETSQSSASSVRISVCSEGPECESVLNPKALVKTKDSRQLSQNTTEVNLSYPLCSLSPGLHLSSGHPCSPWLDVSPLCSLSPRLSLSSSPCHSSISPSTRPASPFLLRHLSPVRAISPICPMSPSSPQSSSFGASVTTQQLACKHRDSTKPLTSTVSSKTKLEKASEAQRRELQAELHVFRHGHVREGQRVLSHLPLHSQPQTPSSSLMIPIGGIQMVQISTISSGLHVNWPKQNPTMAQADEADLGHEETSSSGDIIRHGSAPGEDFQETKEPNANKSDNPSARMTTWKSISQRKKKKRPETKPTHVLKSPTIESTTQTSTDNDTTPRSTWKEKASKVSKRTKSERRL
ncbi:hypothetical protein Baya_2353 [Bagarius yarrelli]|uniref:Uncharacterized protein n=1 Tax=Bagarius yarrelli TaxID=175774 RepID=A0A556TNP5_BAGYA|nr:hypothetical protein Baya_2353 [Bagarius yarrelli]